MNKIVEYKSKEYNFMKKNQKLFLKRKEDIPNKTYYHQATGIETSYEDLVFNCIKLNEHFSKDYNVLQDLYKYSNKTTYTEATEFIRFIYERLDYLHLMNQLKLVIHFINGDMKLLTVLLEMQLVITYLMVSLKI